MAETKHTPGPWTARTAYGRHWVEAGKGRKAVQVADVTDIEIGSGDVDTATTEANARLMAACPELLAALVEARNALAMAQENVAAVGGPKCAEAKFFDGPLMAARAAIAKAQVR